MPEDKHPKVCNGIQVIGKIRETSDKSDSHDIDFFIKGNDKRQGFGYKIKKGRGFIGLIRCPICNRENHMFSVSEGICAWCGWNTQEAKIEKSV